MKFISTITKQSSNKCIWCQHITMKKQSVQSEMWIKQLFSLCFSICFTQLSYLAYLHQTVKL